MGAKLDSQCFGRGSYPNAYTLEHFTTSCKCFIGDRCEPLYNIFISQEDGAYSIYSFEESTLTLKLISYGAFSGTLKYPCRTTAFEIGTPGVFYVLQISASSSLFGCQLSAQIWQFRGTTTPSTIGSEYCLQSEAIVKDFDIAVVGGGSSAKISSCNSGNFPGMVAYSDSADITYASYLCIDVQNGKILINGQPKETRPVSVDVGASPSVAMTQHDGDIYVFSVQGESYCWNTEEHNKVAKKKLCDNKPTKMAYVLSYNLGRFDDWAKHISDQLANKAPQDTTFGSCHSSILHGSYDSGSQPSASLFTSLDRSGKSVLLFAEVHKGLPKDTLDLNSCGFAVPFPGLVLDSWPISNWVK